MNKLLKILVSIMGATNVVFSIFTPLALALLIIKTMEVSSINSIILLIASIVSSLFRGIKIGFIN